MRTLKRDVNAAEVARTPRVCVRDPVVQIALAATLTPD
jgi:hypothetical protein